MDKYYDECQHGKIQAQKNQWNRRLSVLSFIQFVLQKWNGSLFSCWVIFQYFGCLEQVKNNNLIIFILRDFRSAYCLELVLTLSHFINWKSPLIWISAVHCEVTQCFIGVLDVYANPNTLTMFDMSEVQTFKMIDCNKAHYPKEIIQ